MGVVEEPADNCGSPGSRTGSRFGHYQLRRLLGHGGFGEVYEAEDTTMPRVVALKLLAPAYSANPVFRRRLLREARTAGQLNDPHVVPIHQCGEISGQLYIDMRLIGGTDLATVLAASVPLDPARAVDIVGQVASALDAAHATQIIHRDVKPANILLTPGDFACLADFGLANAAIDAKLTSTGTIIGTLAYMAPERFGGSADHRADIYALACVLYECLTGFPPYEGDRQALMGAHMTAPIPRPSQHGSQIPAGFDEVIACGMAKKPDSRYASAGDLADAARRELTMAHRIITRPAVGKSSPSRTARLRYGGQIELPFGRLSHPLGVAVDALSNVYVADHFNGRVLKLAPGDTDPTPITGLSGPSGVAADAAGNIYVACKSSNLVVKVAADGSARRSIRFTELTGSRKMHPLGLAVNTAGTVVYVSDWLNDRVLELTASAATPLPFTGLDYPSDVAVDARDNVYVADRLNDRVLKLSTDAGPPTRLPLAAPNNPIGVTVDAAGNIYVTCNRDHVVLKLPAGATSPIELPFTGLKYPWGVAVDTDGSVYVADEAHNRVLKLPAL